ncbi:hypothetical protein ACFUC1_12340 [Pedococcus sp. NPDC057267]|uniref:hypothetical protein n=1 Tax=Pedococcus sp. NPDC057267 TaxID=3346077 RepID=UPI00362528A3
MIQKLINSERVVLRSPWSFVLALSVLLISVAGASAYLDPQSGRWAGRILGVLGLGGCVLAIRIALIRVESRRGQLLLHGVLRKERIDVVAARPVEIESFFFHAWAPEVVNSEGESQVLREFAAYSIGSQPNRRVVRFCQAVLR